jgi:hypothetical protein
MKAIFIDAQKNVISYVETTGEIAEIKNIISVKHITAFRPTPLCNDIIYVDDEGLINGIPYGFEINGVKAYGNGLILGNDGEDNCSISEGEGVDDYKIDFFILKKN